MKRRDFVRLGTLAAALPAATTALNALATPAATSAALDATKPLANPLLTESGQLGWLGTHEPKAATGFTFGHPWPKGALQAKESLFLLDHNNNKKPLQTWVTATWPDGSVKWTGHAVEAGSAIGTNFRIAKGATVKGKHKVTVRKSGKQLIVDTGVIRCTINTVGKTLFESITRGKKVIAKNARFIGQRQSSAEISTDEPLVVNNFQAFIQSVKIEQDGPVRATLKLDGVHQDDQGRQWLPFSLRMYFYAGGDSLKISHTFIYDGDENTDFIRAMGLRFDVPQHDLTYNRHVRFVGEGKGLFAESPHGLTGLRRDPGEAVRKAQIAGVATPKISTWDKRVSDRIQYIPVWNDYTLSQLNANGFSVKKRTKAGHAWIDIDQGQRASGVAYVGGASGGVLFGMRDFWQLHPTQIDIRHAGTDVAQATLWMWSPDAPAMDLRFYHDGMGMDTYPKQIEGLEITYEDYEPGFGSPEGIARTSEMTLFALDATPTREQTIELADAIRNTGQIIAAPHTYLNAGVFGGLWSLPSRKTSLAASIEERLQWSIDYYAKQIDQRHWYGFWNYGDVMHAYDTDRHVWRYDVGGYAWDNSELSPDLWLWYSFLRSGDPTAFRLAEAMTRHNRDVDIFHLGQFAGLGTRHNVQHWGCSAKQLRISTSIYRRFHYFITADERTGDVLWEVAEADRQLKNLLPTRKVDPKAAEKAALHTHIGVGTDWGSAAANWLTAWERTGDPKYKTWLENAMKVIGETQLGFFAGGFYFDIDTKQLTAIPRTDTTSPMGVSHLNAVFGLAEVCAELLDLIDVPAFKEAWLLYCRMYNAPDHERTAAYGRQLRQGNLQQAYSRLTAYSAHALQDENLAARAWKEFFNEPVRSLNTRRIEGPMVLNPVDEAAWVSTNDSAQWGLAAIQNLALVGKHLK